MNSCAPRQSLSAMKVMVLLYPGKGGVLSLKSCFKQPLNHTGLSLLQHLLLPHFDYSDMMDNQRFGKMLFWELALKAGTDCKEKRKCSALGMERAKCNKSKQKAE